MSDTVHECEFCDEEINYHEIIECIASALDAKDPYTAGHSQRVSDMALKVCRLLGLSDEDIEKIHIAGHLHDIGKIGVPDVALNKAGKLNDEEWEMMKKHPAIGARIIAICDSIDAMTSNRCYRKARDFDYCYREIENNLGKMYDPVIGRCVLNNWEEVTEVVRKG